jgi:hypothetical protein
MNASEHIEMKGAIMFSSPAVRAAQEMGEEILVRLVGQEKADEMIKARKARDGEKARVTIAGPKDAKEAVAQRAARDGLSKGAAEKALKEDLAAMHGGSFTAKGLGHAEGGGNEAYFVVIEWAGGREIRENLGLDRDGQDFHITVGFKGGDVHGVRKDKVIAR